jgi:hypothetical protein
MSGKVADANWPLLEALQDLIIFRRSGRAGIPTVTPSFLPIALCKCRIDSSME